MKRNVKNRSNQAASQVRNPSHTGWEPKAGKKHRVTAIAGYFILTRLPGLLLVVLVLAGCRPVPLPTTTRQPLAASTQTPETVVLSLGSWRPDDLEQMNRILARFHHDYPTITVRHDPTSPPEYNAALEAQLQAGTAPDLFYLRSYATSQALFDKGYLENLGDLPGLRENFAPTVLDAWSSDKGERYGVPFIATSHGVYYNRDIFDQLGLGVPQSWEALLETARTIQGAGTIPFANTSGDPWAVAEVVFMNLAPNFIGGLEGRQAYLSGERCFNDDHMVAAFQALADLAPFFPPNHQLLNYSDSLQLFLQGQAAMFLGGSWEIPFLEASEPPFQWDVFAPPPPKGQPGYVTFHLDVAVGLNAASQHKAEARQFLIWLTSQESAELLGNELPGFFPMHLQTPTLTNEHANAFLALNQGRGTDVRLAWQALRDGTPDGYDLIQAAALAALWGESTPQEAADSVQAGLAQWFAPAQNCQEDR